MHHLSFFLAVTVFVPLTPALSVDEDWEAEVAKRFAKDQPVIGLVGLGEAGKLVVPAPVEAPRFDDDTTHSVAVAADKFSS